MTECVSCRQRDQRFRSLRTRSLRADRAPDTQPDVDDDLEMEAMAKVWAHPEDLPLFPVCPLVGSVQMCADMRLTVGTLLAEHVTWVLAVCPPIVCLSEVT